MISAPDCVGLKLDEAFCCLDAAGYAAVMKMPPGHASYTHDLQRVLCQSESDGGTVCLTVASFLPRLHTVQPEIVDLEQVMAGGCYVLEVMVEQDLQVTVGKLGPMPFTAGIYVYVGSAKKHLPRRLARHSRRHKPLRWHIDYLTTIAKVEWAYVWPWREGLECELAAVLRGAGPVFSGFGSSDCRCGGHLARIEQCMSHLWMNGGIIETPAQLVHIQTQTA